MTRACVLLLVLAAGCGAGNDSGVVPDGGASDAPGCEVSLSYDPDPALAGSAVDVTATLVGEGGVPMWSWHAFAPDNSEVTVTQQADSSHVEFTPATTGTYRVTADPDLGVYCEQGQTYISVQGTGSGAGAYFVRIIPPASVAPPQATFVQVHAGTPVDQPFLLLPGVVVNGSVVAGGSGVPAYVRFTPDDGTGAIVEAFADSSGHFTARLLGASYDALVVPEVPNLAPRVFSVWSAVTAQPLALDAGTTVTGVVKDGAGKVLAGAKVSLASGALPSTLATTDATGAFTIHEAFPIGPVSIVVTPPSSSGLPALTASGALDLTKPLAVQFAALPTCDLAGTHVQRGGAGVVGAPVTVVGAVASAGTITDGTTTATATGAVHATATTGAAGALPSTVVPRALLSAVVAVGPMDRSVVAVDAVACAAPTLDAPAAIAQTGFVHDATGAHPVAGAQLEATPSAAGALALAGAPPAVQAAGSDGGFAIQLAAGASYDLRIADPANRSGARVIAGFTPSATPLAETLAPALSFAGTVTANGNPQADAVVQILCATCTGLDASRPVAEGSTDATGRFQLAVPDPGSM